MEMEEIEAVIEGLLFASGDALPLEKLSEILEIDKKTVKLILNDMTVNFLSSGRGLLIREVDGKYQLCTRPEHHEYLRKLFEPRQRQGLSQAAFEILSIIAYNQPITRAKIEHIRGVSSESAITRLIERNLITEAGRLDAPGKPVLFETTDEFLRSFGFRTIKDLPVLEMNELQTAGEIEPLKP